MAIWYCDANQTYTATASNLGTQVSPWGGVGGIQRALATMAASDSLYISVTTTTGITLNVNKNIKITITATTGAPAVGDIVYESSDAVGTPIANCTGVISRIESVTSIWIESTGSVDWTTGATKYIYKAGPVQLAGPITACPATALTCVTSGSSTNYSTILAVNSLWADDGSMLTLDGNSAVMASGFNYSGIYYLLTKNLKVTRIGSIGFNGNNPSLVFENCQATNNGTWGFQLNNYNLIYKCLSSGNVSGGFNIGTGVVVDSCLASGSTNAYGIRASGNANVIINSISFGNQYGIYLIAYIQDIYYNPGLFIYREILRD